MSGASDRWYLSGPLGIGTPSPEGPLHVKDSTEGTPRPSLIIERKVSPRIGLVDTEKVAVDEAPAWFIDNFSDRFRIFRQPNIGTGGAEFLTVVNDGKVGIGTAEPKYTLDVNSKGIKLGLEGNGGGQLIIGNNENDNKIYIEAFNTGGDGNAAELLLTGRFAETSRN